MGMVPYGIVFIGIVMLEKPTVPLSPVRSKVNAVVLAVWLVVNLRFVICVLVMFPLMLKSTSEPLIDVAVTFVGDCGVETGDEVEVGVGEGSVEAVKLPFGGIVVIGLGIWLFKFG